MPLSQGLAMKAPQCLINLAQKPLKVLIAGGLWGSKYYFLYLLSPVVLTVVFSIIFSSSNMHSNKTEQQGRLKLRP